MAIEKKYDDVELEIDDQEEDEEHQFTASTAKRVKEQQGEERSLSSDADEEEEKQPEEKQAAKEETPKGKEESASDEEEEEYSERVQKRINKEVWKRREAERRAKEVEDRLKALEEQAQQAQTYAFNSDSQLVETREENLKGMQSALQAQYQKAYDDGDTSTMFEVMDKIADIKAQQREIAQRKSQLEQYKEAQSKPKQAPQQPQGPDPRAMEWASNNTWFNQDPVKTGAAYALDATLKQEGYDPSTEDFYEELDARLQRAFPDLAPQPAQAPASQQQKPSQPVVGGSRNAQPGKRVVRLSADQRAMAKRLGVPEEEYARYLSRSGA